MESLSGRALRDLFSSGRRFEWILDQKQRMGVAVEGVDEPLKSIILDLYDETIEALQDLGDCLADF